MAQHRGLTLISVHGKAWIHLSPSPNMKMVQPARYLMLWLALYLLHVCAMAQQAGPSNRMSATRVPVMLGIVGYNYTNHYIDQFYVDGTGGGNIYVSTPTSGGGGTTCCVRYYPGSSLPMKIHVRWTDSACMFPELQPGAGSYVKPETIQRIRHFFKETDVVVNGPIPSGPRNMEIHFYPDGHVEAAITAEYSAPRLRLQASREVEGDPACTADRIAR